jgi:hypothetical protein
VAFEKIREIDELRRIETLPLGEEYATRVRLAMAVTDHVKVFDPATVAELLLNNKPKGSAKWLSK